MPDVPQQCSGCLPAPFSFIRIFHLSSLSFWLMAKRSVCPTCVPSPSVLSDSAFSICLCSHPFWTPSSALYRWRFPALCRQHVSLAHLLSVPRSLIKPFNKISLRTVPRGAPPVTSIHPDRSFNAASPFTTSWPYSSANPPVFFQFLISHMALYHTLCQSLRGWDLSHFLCLENSLSYQPNLISFV